MYTFVYIYICISIYQYIHIYIEINMRIYQYIYVYTNTYDALIIACMAKIHRMPYGVATISRLLKIMSLFCRIRPLL